MICTKCGAEMEDDAKFCPECGNPADEQERAEQRESSVTEEEITEKAEEETEAIPESVQDEAGISEDVQTEQNTASGGPEFDWQAVSQPTPAVDTEKPNKSKAPYIVMGVIGAAILITLVYLIFSLTGIGSPKEQVKKAFQNTYKDLAEKDEYSKLMEAILENDLVSEKFDLSVSEFSVTSYGETIGLPAECLPFRFSMSGITNRADQNMMAEFSGGAGDMKDIRLQLFFDKDSYLFGLPDLYGNYLMLSMEDMEELTGMELNLEESMDRAETQLAIQSLGETLSSWFAAAYNDVECKKTQSVTQMIGNNEVKADEYVLTLSRRNYEKHLKKLPGLIAADEVFMGWFTESTSEEEADEFISLLEEAVEESMFDSSISEVIICYVQIYNGKIIQANFPLDSEEDDMTGGLVLSFFGEENVGDDFRVNLDLTVDGESITADYAAVKQGNSSQIQLSADFAGMASLTLTVDGGYETLDNSCIYRINHAEFSAGFYDYAGASNVSATAVFDGSYAAAEAEAFAVPDKSSAIRIVEMDDEEAQEMVVTVLDNVLQGGYLPSAYKDQLSAIVNSIKASLGNSVGDNGGGSLDGSENLSYEEFVSMVKSVYGDLYTEEELKQLYDSLYNGGADYDTSDIVYGADGLPYLFCYDEDLVLEIRPADGFEFAPDYSDAFNVEYERYIGNTDMIILDYMITTDSAEEHMEWEIDYQKEYYEESGYTDVVIGDVQQGIIGGFSVYWIEYSASDNSGNNAGGIIAYAQLDEEHGCALDMYSIYGSDEVSAELLMKCFDMYLIEN